ncbi:hypothetical protein BATDEDRAFT_88413 [Batrachochytrium dendrobatidis JAM81]|uniref:Uncharacterized protein n=1 Tax=Batrachochytrium dendrobatidis (strain JAM81 / FGSC 10211) TaxID=684364 RepID=F4P1V8_BATDJ|nr:uncharacterized protein BATDEDRAFT_88413 [Batrachochytrium dendrobatidis JAM81]EGF80751.1 hypothetical protein BATDEDRAFT_88413 [Batrachochytrium dendrobatidis JAM81]|eukprot:XP_006678681.1 hypothetical protein BATDEDRAFT_88413 [Batrachochytrium dendrobatidis JAM81]
MALSVLLSQNSLSTSNLLTELKEFPGCLSMYYLNMKAMIAKGSATPYRLEQSKASQSFKKAILTF